MKRRSFLALLALTPLGAFIPRPKRLSGTFTSEVVDLSKTDGHKLSEHMENMEMTFFYGELTPLEMKVMKEYIKRYRWPRRHTPLQLEL